MIPGNINTDLISGADEAEYQVSRSLRFNSADSAYLSRTPASAGNRKTWTWSGWVKKVKNESILPLLNARQSSSDFLNIWFDSGDGLFIRSRVGGSDSFYAYTAAVFRDPSAWYHVLIAVDTTQASSSNGVKVYVNGTQQTLTIPTYNQNADTYVNSTFEHRIGYLINQNSSTYYLDSYLADLHLIDGQALTPSSFGQFDANDEWQPKAYTGTYGTNGFRLDFSDNSAATATTLGKDYSGNSNNWTPNNLSVTAGAGNDSLVDTPTSYGTNTGVGGEVRGNYCTWNPLIKSTYATISNGNLNIVSSNNHGQTLGTIGVQSGKWYWEVDKSTSGNPDTAGLGVMQQEYKQDATWVGNGVGRNYIYLQGGTVFWYDGAGSGSFSNTSLVNNTGIWMFAIDLDAQKMWIGKNGTWYSNAGSAITGPSSGSNAFFTSFIAGGTYFPFHNSDSTAVTYVANFGQRPFAYTAPSGFKALCDTNLPAPVVAKPSTVMDVKLYTGNGSTQTISGLRFSPDLVWGKVRSTTGDHHIVDSVRGDASGTTNKTLFPNTTDFEYSSLNRLYDFSSTGFTAGGVMNTNAATYAAWCWDAGSSTVTNTQGSITSQVRANASAGFSIVTYTGTGANATVGHGLNVSPSLLIIKSRGSARNWVVWHKAFGTAGSTDYLYLNSTLEKGGDGGDLWWNSTVPGSNTFSLGSAVAVNTNAINYVAYCFAPVAGYSSFGSYTGNGSADGPFVFCNFRPRWVMIKKTTDTSNADWRISDAARSPYNAIEAGLYANLSYAEDTFVHIDYCSNGFKLRTGSNGWNGSGSTYIYAAFAESPFQYARAR